MFMDSLIHISKQYWENKLQSDFEKLPIVGGHNTSSRNLKRLTSTVDESTYHILNRLSRGNDFIIFIVMLSAFKIVVERLCDTKDFIVGIPPYFQNNNDDGGPIFLPSSYYTNSNDWSVKDLLKEEKNQLNRVYKHQFYPLEHLYRVHHVFNRTNTFIGMRNLHSEQSLEKILDLDFNDLTVFFEKTPDNLIIDFYINTNFPEEQRKIWLSAYHNVLSNMLKSHDQKINELEMVDELQKKQILTEFNDTSFDYPNEKSIVFLFEEQVALAPERPALQCDESTLTYAELNEKVNKLARTLHSKGVQKETIVAILAKSSIEMIVGILATLKAGGTYLPIDPQYPFERIEYMLQDSRASIMLIHEHTSDLASTMDIQQVNMDVLSSYASETGNLNHRIRSEQLAYIIYTSGTTGKPKGVAVEHRSLVNLCHWHNHYYHVNATDITGKYASVGFDASVWEIFPYLIAGASIRIIPEEIRYDAKQLNDYYEQHGITIAFLPTIMFEQFIKYENKVMKRLLTGGDKLKYVQDTLYELYNNFGPSEYTVVTSSYKIDQACDNIPIGKPLYNTEVYILSQSNQVMPIGVPGELCVAGDGIARGYLHKEELTKQKFVENPFKPGKRMYRTGDLARWLPNGNIEIIGRIDHQVKIRGFRVELGEIESNLLKVNGIQDVIVLDKTKDGSKVLCAYYVSQIDNVGPELRQQLKINLPDYMIPTYFIKLDHMPLTPNGKIDRKALPEPEEMTVQDYVAPRNDVEKQLAKIWANVLSVNKIGIQDDFFELGGHSLKAAKLLGRIHEQMGISLSLKELFTYKTIETLSQYMNYRDTVRFEAIEKVSNQDFYEASSAQKRMYLIQQLDRDNVAYNIPCAIEIKGKLDYDKLDMALYRQVERHEAFRTLFSTIDGKVVQHIVPMEKVNFKVDRLTAANKKEAKELMVDFIQPFDLQTQIPIRAAVIQLHAECNYLLLDLHHIIADGTTAGILIEEFNTIYSGQELEPLKLQYKDYASWQLKRIESDEMKVQESYWLSEFGDELPILQLPIDYKRSHRKDYLGNRVGAKLNSRLTANLKKIARDTESTLYMVLLAAIKILLSRYSGQKDIIVGTPIAGRNHPDTESMMGVFVNTLAIRSTLNGEWSFTQYLETVKQKTLNALEHQEYPFEDLVENLDMERNQSRNPLFDVMFVYQNTDIGQWYAEGLSFIQNDLSLHAEKFDLTWNITEKKGEIELVLSYATSLFKKKTIKKMVTHFNRIIEKITDNSEVMINQIEMISNDEKLKILNDFNPAPCDHSGDRMIHKFFETQAIQTPYRPAVICNGSYLTYQELNEKSNALARALRDRGVVPDSLVAIMMERSMELIVGILAILKAGGAYLPMDPEHPQERKEYILNNSQAKYVLTDKTEKILGVETLNIHNSGLYCAGTNNLDITVDPENLAYVIYTSGTTGNPKGVAIQHKAVLNTLRYLQRRYPFHEGDRYLFKTNYTFDVSVSELFGWFFTGGQLVILQPGIEKEPAELVEFIADNQITHVNFTSSMFNMFINEVNDNSFEKLQGLKYILTAGEELKFENLNKVKRLLETVKIENLYGPTEAAIYATSYSVKQEDIGSRIPIGKPIDNCRIYIIDAAYQPVPIGVAGELYIAGDGLAGGYFRNEEMTEKNFVADPFETGAKMYRTGDLAKWKPDGNIEFLGRIDHQVKIRGYRIELMEIENSLMKLEGMQKVLVMDKERAGNKFLIAYYTASIPYSISILRKELTKSLPNYMVPSNFVELDEFPINSSGKIDRKSLPEDFGDIYTGMEYRAPENEREKMLAAIWEAVLGRNKVGVLDDFFDLGGDSIKAMQIVSKIREQRYQAEVKDIFLSLTIRELSKCLIQQESNDEQGAVVGEVELTPIQKWFFESKFSHPHHWNQAVMLYKQEGFQDEILESAFRKIITHHDALRMSFTVDAENQVVQTNRDAGGKLFDLQVHDFRNTASRDIQHCIEEISRGIQTSIHLQEGPLIKLGLFKAEEGDHLLIAIHHLVIDGLSWRILFEDFARAYDQAKKGEMIVLPRKSMSYQKWAAELKKYANNGKLAKEVEYWRKVENCQTRQLKRDRSPIRNYRRQTAETITEMLSVEETEKLLFTANTAYNTEINDLLLTALVYSISEFFEENTVPISLEGHGREEIVPDANITRTIGWFTTQYPVVFQCIHEDDLARRIVNIKDHLRRVPNKGIGYGLLRYLQEEQTFANLEFKLEPEIIFNYLGQFDTDIDTSLFELSSVSPGHLIGMKNKMDHSLEFVGMVSGNRLILSLTYNSEEFDKKTIVNLIQHYMKQLREIIKHCLTVDVPVRTISDITKEHITRNELSAYENEIDDIEVIYPLVPMQKGIMFHSMIKEQSEAYHETMIINLEGELELELLKKALQAVVDKHEMLRTNFDHTNFQDSMQIIFKMKKVRLDYSDISAENTDSESYVKNKMIEDRLRGFNLKEDLLIRLTVIKTKEKYYTLIISNHHIIMDGWSTGIVLTDLFQIYHKLKTGQSSHFEKGHAFSHFIEWIADRNEEDGKTFWKHYLAGVKEPSQIPFDSKAPSPTYVNRKLVLLIAKDKVEKLEEIASHFKVTLNNIIQALWSFQLQKYNNSKDSVFGFVVSGRNPEVKAIEEMVGLLINTIPLRVDSTNLKSFRDLVQQVRVSTLNIRNYDDYPLADLQALSEMNGELFNHIMVFENFPIDMEKINTSLNETGLQFLDYEVFEQTNYDFNLIVSYEKELYIRYSYNENRINEQTVQMIAKHFENLVEEIICNENILLEDLVMVRDDQKIKEIEKIIEEQEQNSKYQIDFNF
ncbi:non-ribosomal peptide synthetase [Bacillus atrophaeus]|uniref:non-ribosomal peptide synthetase n=1 Tax=Bacillus atrophaeus TaxID=1452 RepID=UPI00227E2163|nr:non-ribosomal peptide synthetase [Bacillus atrophaeus]MCY8823358.1 amino acid adenylation domain-containing protein [Bacillus atrophaeus]